MVSIYHFMAAVIWQGAIATSILEPVLAPQCDTANLSKIQPASRVDLHYGRNGESLAIVTLHVDHPAVLLEEIKAVSSVECTADTIAVGFNTLEAYEQALSQWSSDGGFVLISNHDGECDDEDRRGIFLVMGLDCDNTTSTVKASVDRMDIRNITSLLEVTFAQLTTVHPNKRDITYNQTGIYIAGNTSLPADQRLFSSSAFNATAHKASMSDSITLSGYLMYDINSISLTDLYFDLNASFAADLALGFELNQSISQSFSLMPDSLQYSLLNIPNVLQLGPSLLWSIGADVEASLVGSAQLNASLALEAGRLHLDFVNTSATRSSGWAFEHETSVDFAGGETPALRADPYLDFSFAVALRILDGAVDLSGGFTARPRFFNELGRTLSPPGTSLDNGGGNSSKDDDGACDGGIGYRSGFELDVFAFVAEWWRAPLYRFQEAIVEQCLG